MHNAYGIPTDFSYTQRLPTTPTHLCLSTIVPTHLIYLLTYAYPHYLPTYAYPLMPTHAYAYLSCRCLMLKAQEHLIW